MPLSAYVSIWDTMTFDDCERICGASRGGIKDGLPMAQTRRNSRSVSARRAEGKLGDTEIMIDTQTNWWAEADSSARNWVEDYQHENGMYINSCVGCKLPFMGHKRRVTCKECADNAKSEFSG